MKALLAVLLLARVAAAATTFYVLTSPGGAATTVSATADQMWCATIASPFGLIAGLNNVSGVVTGACSSGTFGWAVYPDDDSAAPLAVVTAACTSAGIKSNSASGVAFQDNTPYRFCFCSSTSADGTVLVSSGTIATLFNAFTTKVGHATTGCTSGVPPNGGTGALISDTAAELPWMKLQ